MKHIFKRAVRPLVPDVIAERKDKMGFPVPLTEWLRGEAREFAVDTLSSQAARERPLFDNRKVLAGLEGEGRFGRKIWGLLCLELWQQTFHDQQSRFKTLLTAKGHVDEGSDHGRGRVHRLPPRRSAAG
jgi:asparagine synthase (glutamine-hydrolysing)